MEAPNIEGDMVMAFIKKYNTFIFIGIVVVVCCIAAMNWGGLSLVRKLTTVFAVFAALHEIEEKVWPGGFFDLMLKKFKLKKEDVDLGRATLAVSIYWLILLGSAWLFDSHAFPLTVTMTLAFFEAFVHTAGIWIHHLKKPYTPGLVTAWCMAIIAAFAVRALNGAGIASGKDYLLGAVSWVISFICLFVTIYSGFGKSIPELIATVKENE